MKDEKNKHIFLLVVGPKCYFKQIFESTLILCNKKKIAYETNDVKKAYALSSTILSKYGIKTVPHTTQELENRR